MGSTMTVDATRFEAEWLHLLDKVSGRGITHRATARRTATRRRAVKTWRGYSRSGRTRGVPKWKCKSCGRQTSLRGCPAETDPEKEKKHGEAVLLYLSGLSLKAIAFLKAVLASTILNWVRQFARQWAAKPKPGPEGVIVMELDEIGHFVGHKGHKLWIWLALCRDTGKPKTATPRRLTPRGGPAQVTETDAAPSSVRLRLSG